MRERKIRKKLLKALPLETERLRIRYIEPDDAYDMFDYASRQEVCKYLLWDPHINISVTEGYIESLRKRYLRGLYGDWAIELKSNGRMIGTCGYAMIDSASNSCEIGYVLSPEYRGKGYMTEAVNEVLRLSFEVLELSKASLRIINENEASKRLAERVGFSLERIGFSEMLIKDSERDIAHYAMTNEEYNKK